MNAALLRRPRRPLAVAEIWLWRHGWWGPLSLALLLAAAAIWTWQVRPTVRQIELADAAMRLPRTTPTQPDGSSQALTESQRLLAFRGVLAPQNQNTQVMRRVVATTLQELQWSQAEFQQTNDAGLGVVRVQITVPVVGAYRPMRRALERALREVPGLSLDQVSFRRLQANQTELEARLKMSLWLAPLQAIDRTDATPQESTR